MSETISVTLETLLKQKMGRYALNGQNGERIYADILFNAAKNAPDKIMGAIDHLRRIAPANVEDDEIDARKLSSVYTILQAKLFLEGMPPFAPLDQEEQLFQQTMMWAMLYTGSIDSLTSQVNTLIADPTQKMTLEGRSLFEEP